MIRSCNIVNCIVCNQFFSRNSDPSTLLLKKKLNGGYWVFEIPHARPLRTWSTVLGPMTPSREKGDGPKMSREKGKSELGEGR